MTTKLTEQTPETYCRLGDMVFRYRLLGGGAVEFTPLPVGMEADCREFPQRVPFHPALPGADALQSWNGLEPDRLTQIAVRGMTLPRQHAAGRTMRNGAATLGLRFAGQEVREGGAEILTRMESDAGFVVTQRVWHPDGAPGVCVSSSVRNTGVRPLPVEMLSSFSLAGLSPFGGDDLLVHRFRAAWSNEALHEVRTLAELALERNWGSLPASLRFGQTGSLPVRGWHPFVGLEDRGAGVFWAAQLAWHGSWQMEIYRRDDAVSLSGGLGDFEFAHWMKELAPGELFESPMALLTVVRGGFDDACGRLVRMQDILAHPEPEHERDLPIIFNEWCSSWGAPDLDHVTRTAEKLATTPTRYLVIDDGWAEKPAGTGIQSNGDWEVNSKAFPGGLREAADAIRRQGLIPGIWFEIENCTEGSRAFELTGLQLKSHGKVLQVGPRRFWDFRNPDAVARLRRILVGTLRDNGIGYLKIDYNDSIGIGCDGAESLGEGLRAHLAAVREFFHDLRRELPDLVLENCSSGGCRIEPGFVGLSSLTSTSDAHETMEIPIIAAQMHRLIPPRKNQIWAVLRAGDSPELMAHRLAATFLGRMCISGDVAGMDEPALDLLRKAQEFYTRAVPVIRDGHTRIYGGTGPRRRRPSGWQAVVRTSSDGTRALVVLHTFENPASAPPIEIPFPGEGEWQVEADFDCGVRGGMEVESNRIICRQTMDFRAAAWLMRRPG